MKRSPLFIHDIRWLVGLVLLVCLGQFPRGIDLQGYLWTVHEVWAHRFSLLPYPTQPVGQGAYFQSPVVTLFLLPLGQLPLLFGKLVWALLCAAGFVALLRRFHRSRLLSAPVLFLLLWFTYPLSDVFLSGNMNFAMLFCLAMGWMLLESRSLAAHWGGAALVALAIFIKPLAVIFPAWFLLAGDWRKTFSVLLATVGWALLPLAVMGRSLGMAWWKGWWGCLQFYPLAADPGRPSFQSPPAAVFRLLGDLTSLSWTDRLLAANIVGIALVALFLVLALRVRTTRGPRSSNHEALALLLVAIYVSSPFGWACTILFFYPLLALYAEKGSLSFSAWLLALAFALSQKAILPAGMWDKLIHWNLHCVLLLAMTLLALGRVVRSSGKATVGGDLKLFRGAFSS